MFLLNLSIYLKGRAVHYQNLLDISDTLIIQYRIPSVCSAGTAHYCEQTSKSPDEECVNPQR